MKLNAVKCNRCGRVHSVEIVCEIKNTMTTEQELKDRCTPKFIKLMVEFAEGFSIADNTLSYNNQKSAYRMAFISEWYLFPLLIHRAVGGWNKKHQDAIESISFEYDDIMYGKNKYPMPDYITLKFKNYQPQTLTQAECAMLHCLLDIFEVEKR